mgnify:CR=1 FL=1
MKLQEYFSDLPNRLSANFLALIGFVNFMCFVFANYSVKEMQSQVVSTPFEQIIYICLFCSTIFGAISIPVIFLLSIPFFFLLGARKKSISLISVIFFLLSSLIIKFVSQ